MMTTTRPDTSRPRTTAWTSIATRGRTTAASWALTLVLLLSAAIPTTADPPAAPRSGPLEIRDLEGKIVDPSNPPSGYDGVSYAVDLDGEPEPTPVDHVPLLPPLWYHGWLAGQPTGGYDQVLFVQILWTVGFSAEEYIYVFSTVAGTVGWCDHHPDFLLGNEPDGSAGLQDVSYGLLGIDQGLVDGAGMGCVAGNNGLLIGYHWTSTLIGDSMWVCATPGDNCQALIFGAYGGQLTLPWRLA